MGRYKVFLLCVVSLAVLTQVGAQDTSAPGDTTRFEAKYKLILERNIFSRTRQVYREVVEVPRDEPPPPPLEASFVVVGISRQNDMTIAFIEDTSLGKVDQYAVNSHIANGKIQAMTLDVLKYAVASDANDPNTVTVTDVKLGQSLLGEASIGASRTDRRSRDRGDRRDSGRGPDRDERPAPQTSEADSISDEDMDEVLRRMMEARQNE